jgi:hypothetical protein
MGDKEKVLRDADDAYEELRQAVAGLDEAQTRTVWLGSWGVKEILIHIYAWDREMAPSFPRIDRGEPPYAAGAYDDYDTWNARFVEAGKEATHREVLEALETSHRDLVTAAGRLGEEHFAEGASARGLFESIAAQHYREHATQIREWRSGHR